MNELKSFSEVLTDYGYDAEFWAKAVTMYWCEQTGFDRADWLDTPHGVDFAYRLCLEFSDGGIHRNVYEMFELALTSAFAE